MRKGEDVPAVADTVESSEQESDTGIYTCELPGKSTLKSF